MLVTSTLPSKPQSSHLSIVHHYEEEGTDAFKKLNGMFSIAIWDRPKRRAVLVRDRPGIKPLCDAFTPDGLAFAFEIKAVLDDGAHHVDVGQGRRRW